MATYANPPLPPDITAQQVPPNLRFMQGAGAAQQAQQQPDSMTYASSLLSEVAAKLKDVATVLAVDKPALLPILQKMLQAGSALMEEIQAAMPQRSPSPGANDQAQSASPAGAVSMS